MSFWLGSSHEISFGSSSLALTISRTLFLFAFVCPGACIEVKLLETLAQLPTYVFAIEFY